MDLPAPPSLRAKQCVRASRPQRRGGLTAVRRWGVILIALGSLAATTARAAPGAEPTPAAASVGAQTPARPAPSPKNITAHLAWISALDVHDPGSVLLAIDASVRLLGGTQADEAPRRQVWDAVRGLHKKVVASWNGRIGANRPWADALDAHFGRPAPRGPPPTLLLSLLQAVQRYGALVQHDNGSAWLEADVGWLAERLEAVAPADERRHAAIESLEQRAPAMVQDTLLISLEALRERIGMWEELLRRHPATRHGARSDRWMKRYLTAYLDPLRHTPGKADAVRLQADRRASYKRFLALHPRSPHRAQVQAALQGLQAESGDSPALARAREAIDQAASEVEQLQGQLNLADGDPKKLAEVARVFGAWAKTSDARLARLADALARDDARRLSAYAAARLFPVIESLMNRLERAGAPAQPADPTPVGSARSRPR